MGNVDEGVGLVSGVFPFFLISIIALSRDFQQARKECCRGIPGFPQLYIITCMIVLIYTHMYTHTSVRRCNRSVA
jgi:hypothetical protein